MPRMLCVALLCFFVTLVKADKVPFSLCQERDHLRIETIDVHPLPAHPGDELTITASGTPDLDIEEGTMVSIDAEQHGIHVGAKTYNICEAGPECPSPAGSESSATFSYQVPRIATQGKATSTVITTGPDGNVISCVKVEIQIVRQRVRRGDEDTIGRDSEAMVDVE